MSSSQGAPQSMCTALRHDSVQEVPVREACSVAAERRLLGGGLGSGGGSRRSGTQEGDMSVDPACTRSVRLSALWLYGRNRREMETRQGLQLD